MSGNRSPKKDGATTTAYPCEQTAFDRLPKRLRECLARAPIKYGVRAIEQDLMKAKGDVEQARRTFIAAVQADMMRRTARTYGPDHPQAQPGARWR